MWDYDFCAISLLAFMPTNDSDIQIQARRILDAIAFIPFEQCQPLTRGFESIPARPGIYAIRHRTDGLLYIAVKPRAYEVASVVGTKLFFGHGSINIAMKTYGLQYRQFLTLENPALLLELEAIILRAAEPPYNVQIPTEM
ncbi:GIY-YIG nuclease family protein [Microcoleus sp. B3-D7]|uniref:GIY-YIG nuclease family protein n=1 Tax=Microcoleus sp. B3-D7 TaxID=2818659 RepID=UPI002FD60BE3